MMTPDPLPGTRGPLGCGKPLVELILRIGEIFTTVGVTCSANWVKEFWISSNTCRPLEFSKFIAENAELPEKITLNGSKR